MKKNNKVSFGFTAGALICAIVAVFMGFAEGFKLSEEGYTLKYDFFDYVFHKGDVKTTEAWSGWNLHHYNVIYIIGFVLLILAICALVALAIMKLTKKENKQLEMTAIIVAIAGLVIPAIFAFCGTAIVKGELYQNGITKEMMDYISLKLGAGAIVSGIFGILGAGCSVGALITKE